MSREIEDRGERPAGGRWSNYQSKWVKRPDIDRFIQDVIKVCQQHGLTLTSNPRDGGVIISELREDTVQELLDASIGTSVEAFDDEEWDNQNGQ